jgi:GNAT superfamily N-acetyltransferase
MIESLVVKPMTEEFILWCCLHGGPLSCNTIDQWSSSDKMPWDRYRKRNLPLLEKLTKTYGACAIIAQDADKIVGQLRFYPKVIYDLKGAGYLCLQQDPSAGPEETFADRNFPSQSKIKDKTLLVHCMMTGSSLQEKNPYQRKGIGTRMVRVLIEWAKSNNWDRIEADAFEDIPIIYEITGSAGQTFWEKLGFHLADRHPHPELQDRSQFGEFIRVLEEQAKSLGIKPEEAIDRLIMRLDLT